MTGDVQVEGARGPTAATSANIISRGFTFERGRTGVLLLHGLGGTPVEMRFLASGLARAGFSVNCPQLAGHCGTFHDLKVSTWRDWYASAEAGLEALRSRCDRVIVAGLSMGAVLGMVLAANRKADVQGLAMFAPTLKLNGWAVPWYARLFPLVRHKAFANLIEFNEREPFGVKDPRVRTLVSAALQSGDSRSAGNLKVPGGAVMELDRLASEARRLARDVRQPVLIIHPREDDRTRITNSHWLQRNLGGMVDMITLEDSYHIVTIDRQRHVVTDRTVAFAQSLAECDSTITDNVVPAARRAPVVVAGANGPAAC